MIRRAAFAGVCASALLLLAAPRAGAHALLERADPTEGAALRRSPSAVVLSFTEAPDPDLSRIDVLDTDGGRVVDATVPEVDARAMSVPLRKVDKGVYTVSWRVVSRVDGHLTAGAYAFGVGVSPTEIDEASASSTTNAAAFRLSGSEVGARVVLYIGLLLLVGGAWSYGFAFRTPPPGARGLMLAAGIVAVDGVILLAFAQQRAAGVPFSTFLGTAVGAAIVQRGIAVVVALAAVVVGWFAERRRRVAWEIAGVAAAAAMYVHASAGHAAAGGLVAAKLLAQFVHLAAAGIWIGGLAAVLAGMRAIEPDERLRAVRRFSTVAGVTLVVVAGTGVVRAVQEVGSWSALWTTGYGRIVLGKGAGLVLLGAIGALNRYRNVSRAGEEPRSLAGAARLELATSVGVLVLAALLASLAPSKSSASGRADGAVTAEGSDFAGNVDVRLEIVPGRAGVNAFELELDAEDDDAVRAVSVRLSPADGNVEPTRLELEERGGRWVARASAIAAPGRWRAIVTVDRGADSVEVPLEFHTACPSATAQETGDLTLYTIDLGPQSVQGYVDPARTGNNEVHFTVFDGSGAEVVLADEGTVSASGDERSIELDVRQLSPGHVVAGGRLTRGEWVFDFVGETEGGEAVNVCFEDEIR